MIFKKLFTEMKGKKHKHVGGRKCLPPKPMFSRHPRYKGFILIAEYPGCRRKKGDFEPYTSGEFLKYPDVWKPVLHDDVARDEKLNQLGIK